MKLNRFLNLCFGLLVSLYSNQTNAFLLPIEESVLKGTAIYPSLVAAQEAIFHVVVNTPTEELHGTGAAIEQGNRIYTSLQFTNTPWIKEFTRLRLYRNHESTPILDYSPTKSSGVKFIFDRDPLGSFDRFCAKCPEYLKLNASNLTQWLIIELSAAVTDRPLQWEMDAPSDEDTSLVLLGYPEATFFTRSQITQPDVYFRNRFTLHVSEGIFVNSYGTGLPFIATAESRNFIFTLKMDFNYGMMGGPILSSRGKVMGILAPPVFSSHFPSPFQMQKISPKTGETWIIPISPVPLPSLNGLVITRKFIEFSRNR